MKEMKEKEIIEKIRSRIGKSVDFTYPNGRKLIGTLKDRVVVGGMSATSRKKFYYDVIDLIEFEDGEDHIRFGYYIYDDEKGLRWGSQTTLTEPKSVIVELFKKAYEKRWFKELIDEISIP